MEEGSCAALRPKQREVAAASEARLAFQGSQGVGSRLSRSERFQGRARTKGGAPGSVGQEIGLLCAILRAKNKVRCHELSQVRGFLGRGT
jgi:hypothetical protein